MDLFRSNLKFSSFKKSNVSSNSNMAIPRKEIQPANIANYTNVAQPISSIDQYPNTYPILPESEAEGDFSIKEYIGIILHRKYTMLVTILLFLFAGFFTRFDFKPEYINSSKIRILEMKPTENPLEKTVKPSSNLLTPHLDNLKSTPFLTSVLPLLDTNISVLHLKNIFRVKADENSKTIEIFVQSKNPDFSEKLVSILAAAYQEYDLSIKQNSLRDYENWLEEELAKKELELNAIDINIKNFLEANPTFYKDGKAEIDQAQNQIDLINLQLTEIEKEIQLIGNEFAATDSQILSEITYDKPLQKELLNLKLERAKLLSVYGQNHRSIHQIDDKMLSIAKLIEEQADSESNTSIFISNPRYYEIRDKHQQLKTKRTLLLTRKNEIEGKLASSSAMLSAAPEIDMQFERLNRTKAMSVQAFTTLKNKLQETQMMKSSMPKEVFVMEKTNGPSKRIPKNHIGLWQSLGLGFAIGFILCLLMEKLDGTIRKSMEVKSKFGINLLSIIPHSPENRIRNFVKGQLVLGESDLEPFRRLTANINIKSGVAVAHQPSTLVTSALQGEGKTTTAAYLAITAAMKGEKVLLIDADLRRSSIHNLFNLENKSGLSEYLLGFDEYHDCIQKSNTPNLFVMPAGQEKLSLTKSVSQLKFQDLLQKSYREFDSVIIDSPPTLKVSDSLIIAPMVSQVLIVFRSEKTPFKAGEELMRQLQYINANVAGCILNDVSKAFFDRYYYDYYNYGYYDYHYEAKS